LPFLQGARSAIDRDAPSGRRLGIAFDEWNTLWHQSGSVPMGLYVAGMLNLLCREAEPTGIDLACYFMPINEGAIQVTPRGARLDTAGVVFELFKVHQGCRILRCSRPSPDADIDLCASATPDGKRVHLTLINRSITNPRTLEIVLKGDALPTAASVHFLVPRAVKFEEKEFQRRDEALPVTGDARLRVRLAPGCIARVVAQFPE